MRRLAFATFVLLAGACRPPERATGENDTSAVPPDDERAGGPGRVIPILSLGRGH